MKLVDFDPKLTKTRLRFRCPACGGHQIVIPINCDKGWMAAGSIEDLSVSPSIQLTDKSCGWHGFVTNGKVITL